MVHNDLPLVSDKGSLNPENAAYGTWWDSAYLPSGQNKGRAGVGFASASHSLAYLYQDIQNQRIDNSFYHTIKGNALSEVKA